MNRQRIAVFGSETTELAVFEAMIYNSRAEVEVLQTLKCL